jgi:transcriptional regulator with XRE-family HTH domain
MDYSSIMGIADQLRTEAKKRIAAKKNPVSRYRLAKDTGIDESHFGKWLNGDVGLSAENLDKLATALGLKIVLVKKGRR